MTTGIKIDPKILVAAEDAFDQQADLRTGEYVREGIEEALLVAQRLTTRWRMANDDDGHSYCIKEEEVPEFYNLLEQGELDKFADRFDSSRIDGPGSVSFTDPKFD